LIDGVGALGLLGDAFPLHCPETYQWICMNPKEIPPDDRDDEILGNMVKEANTIYKWQLKLLKW
jgi:hypothetical protein